MNILQNYLRNSVNFENNVQKNLAKNVVKVMVQNYNYLILLQLKKRAELNEIL